MTSRRPFRLVAFDMAGVLVRVLPWPAAHAACAYEDERLPPLPSFLPRMSQLNHAYDCGQLSIAEYENLAARASGGRYSVEDVHTIHSAQLNEEFPGIPALFDALAAIPGLSVAVLSNTNPSHWSRIEDFDGGVSRYPSMMRAHHRVASFQVGAAKPDPVIYHELIRVASVDSDQVIFFDDMDRNVDGARSVGWVAERVDPEGDVAAQLRGFLRSYHIVSD